jgi:hypothetical protein
MSKARFFTSPYILLICFVVTVAVLPLSGCAENGTDGGGTRNPVLMQHMYSPQPSPYREHL